MKLTDVVNRVLLKMDKPTPHDRARFKAIGKDGLLNIFMDVSGIPSMVQLQLNTANMTAPIPPDFMKEIRVLVCINGRLFPLKQNNSICLPPSKNDCGDNVYDQPQYGAVFNTAVPSFTDPTYYDGVLWNGFFNIPAGNSIYGNYRFDHENHVIVFQNLYWLTQPLGGHLVLEYLGDMSVDSTGDYDVHPFDALALENYIYWQAIQFKAEVPLSQKQWAKQNYYLEKTNALRRHKAHTTDELSQAYNEGLSLTPKV